MLKLTQKIFIYIYAYSFILYISIFKTCVVGEYHTHITLLIIKTSRNRILYMKKFKTVFFIENDHKAIRDFIGFLFLVLSFKCLRVFLFRYILKLYFVSFDF